MTSNNLDVLIIGAGVAGLSAARVLEAAGLSVAIVDKGRGLGGRLATRRLGNVSFDHGAQYFTADSLEFQNEVRAWLDAGWIRPWFNELPLLEKPAMPAPPRPRYIPTGVGMTSLPKMLAHSLQAPLYLGERIARLTFNEKGWLAFSDTKHSFQAKKLLLTLPVPQALDLLEASALVLAPHQKERLYSVTYAPSLALMGILPHQTTFPYPHGLALGEDAPLRWLACNRLKYPEHDKGDKAALDSLWALTIHGSAAFSKAYFEQSDEIILEAWKAPLMASLNVDPFDFTTMQIHRWRYAFAQTPLTEESLRLDFPQPCVMAGDAFGQGVKVETAWRSGYSAAKELLES
ncbi:MAG: NAD(P)-binding protein [Vampirovibrio sp.]